MKQLTRPRGTAAGSTRMGALLGVVAGVLLAAFVLVDPLNLHGLDERLQKSTADHTVEHDSQPQLWTCGMHPYVIQDEPGTCPICQMDLVRLEHQSTPNPVDRGETTWTCPAHDIIDEEQPGECPICGRALVTTQTQENHTDYADGIDGHGGPMVTLDPSVIQKMNVRTAADERRDLTRRIQTVGHLDYDEKRMVSITTRYSGFIERVFVNHVGQPVRKGDPLFEVYSPDLVQTQRELIAAVAYARHFEGAAADIKSRAQGLVEAARTRLEYWEIPKDRVAEIEASGEIHRTLTVFAPADGLVMQRMHGLDGMAIQPGMELLHLADLSVLWLRAEVYEHQLPFLGVGSRAKVSFEYQPGEAFSGRVRFIEPEVSPKTRTVRLTLEVPNPSGRLRVGMFATVDFAPMVSPAALVIPSQAVIRSGDRNIAVLALGGGRFAPVEVTLGNESDGLVEIIDGLAEGDEIVVSSQFLIDSESNLRAAISSLLATRSGHQH